MLDGSPTHTRDAKASPGFLLAARANPQSSRPRHGVRPSGRAPPRRARKPTRRPREAIVHWGIHSHINHDLEESDMRTIAYHRFIAAVLGTAVLGTTALAAVTPPPGYIYTTELLKNLTEGCVAAGPGGTFVGIGPGLTANGQAIVLAKESGELRLVAMGFNSIADCA